MRRRLLEDNKDSLRFTDLYWDQEERTATFHCSGLEYSSLFEKEPAAEEQVQLDKVEMIESADRLSETGWTWKT